MHLVEIKIPAVREISFLLKEQTISNSMNNTLLWHFNCITTYNKWISKTFKSIFESIKNENTPSYSLIKANVLEGMKD